MSDGWLAHGVGTIVVGGAAYWIGSTVTRVVYELTIEGKPITVHSLMGMGQ